MFPFILIDKIVFSLLAQVTEGAVTGAEAVQAVPPWWHVLLDNALALTILVIFLTAIITVVVQQRRKDKCLKLLRGYHVSYLSVSGKVMWGDLIVYSKGLELVYDAPYETNRGIHKSSSLIYESDMANCLAICRSVDALTDREKRLRLRQIRRSFKPGLARRLLRWFRNIISTLKDAFSKAFSVVLGQITKRAGGMLSTQQSGMDQIGQTLIGVAGNAYEPILERHIGRPVVLQLSSPADPDKKKIDLPGFLVDYTDLYIAVFNVDHEPVSEETVEVKESVTMPGYRIDVSDQAIIVTCTGPDILIIQSVKTDKRFSRLEVPLTNGTSINLGRDASTTVELKLERTRRVDIICPRTQATVLFGGDEQQGRRMKQDGIAPEQLVEQASDDPVG